MRAQLIICSCANLLINPGFSWVEFAAGTEPVSTIFGGRSSHAVAGARRPRAKAPR
jgi:hypothetical protein